MNGYDCYNSPVKSHLIDGYDYSNAPKSLTLDRHNCSNAPEKSQLTAKQSHAWNGEVDKITISFLQVETDKKTKLTTFKKHRPFRHCDAVIPVCDSSDKQRVFEVIRPLYKPYM